MVERHNHLGCGGVGSKPTTSYYFLLERNCIMKIIDKIKEIEITPETILKGSAVALSAIGLGFVWFAGMKYSDDMPDVQASDITLDDIASQDKSDSQ